MKKAVRLFKALGDPTRLRIINLLEGGELCVCQLTAALGMGQSRISRHLSILREAGLIEDRRRGKWVHYRLSRQGLPRQVGSTLIQLARDPAVRRDRLEAERARLSVPCKTHCHKPATKQKG
jgi:DNA-binding transcriptional ArsR family regulator